MNIGTSGSNRHPPLEHHAARARHGQQVAIPRGLRCVTGHPAVRTVVVNESLKVG